MALKLSKGENLSLLKADPTITKAMIGLGWDIRTTAGRAFDLDASAILVGANGKVRSDADFIFYGQMQDAIGSVVHLGDNRTGEGEGDDEQILIDLNLVPADVAKVVIAVSIYEAQAHNLNFGQVRNSFVRIVNNDTQSELAHYELGEEVASENAVIFAEIYRYNGEWRFRAVGQGYTNGLAGIGNDFGVQFD
ncbi:MAG: chemical-damaging agent resistance protein [Glaciihabitans sp.]|nr:chemical-damaging agent resistance protein [Glaciihabitans sp.]